MIRSAPCSTARENTGVAKTLSTITSAPIRCAKSDSDLISITSSAGLEIDSKKTARVSAVIAACHCAKSVPSTKLTFTPYRGRTCSNTYRQDPNNARPATTWSPAFSTAINVPLTAAMPVAVAKPSSVPSSAAIRSSNIATVGLP